MAVSQSWTFGLGLDEFAAVQPEVAEHLSGTHVEGRAAYVAQMVVEEIVRNLIEHTPPWAQGERVTVEVAVGADTVTVVVEDTRPPFDPLEAPELDITAPLEERRAGGMGLHLVRKMTDELRYERRGERNVLTASVSRT